MDAYLVKSGAAWATAAMMLGTPMAAEAVTVSVNRDTPSATAPQFAPTSSANFNAGLVGTNLNAGLGVRARTPFEEFGALANVAPFAAITKGGFAEYAFSSTQDSFAFTWGSPDSYNTVGFYSGGALVFSIMGNDAQLATASGFVPTRKFVNVSITDIAFDTVRLSSSNDSFEYVYADTIAPVPLPVSGALLVAGIGGILFAGRRQRGIGC